MNLIDKINEEHSKKVCVEIVNWVGSSQKKFDELLNLLFQENLRLVQRASWPLTYCVQNHPALIEKHYSKVIAKLEDNNQHTAVHRNCMRLLEYVNIPEKYQGAIMDICFEAIADPKEKAAVKASSLTVLENLMQAYPEIKSELLMIIEDRLEQETAAYQARAKRILKKYK